MESRDPVVEALCCMIALLRREGRERILDALPQDRRVLVDALPVADPVARLQGLRQADRAVAMARAGVVDQVAWTSIPHALQQLLSNRGPEGNG